MRLDYQVHLPCRLSRRGVIDGDTIEIHAVSGFAWRIRLKDVNCPEPSTDAGKAATEFCADVLAEAAGELSAVVTLSPEMAEAVRKGQSFNPLNAPSFNRLVGDIWLGESDRLTDVLVNAGHAERV